MVSIGEARAHRGAMLVAGLGVVTGVGLLLREGLRPFLGNDLSWLAMGLTIPYIAQKAYVIRKIYGPSTLTKDGETKEVKLPTASQCVEQGNKRVYGGEYTVDLDEKPLGEGAVKTVRVARDTAGNEWAASPVNATEARLLSLIKPDTPIFLAPEGGDLKYVAIVPKAKGDLRTFVAGKDYNYMPMFKGLLQDLVNLHKVRVNGLPASHRDLKADNILVDEKRHAWLIDFGWLHGMDRYIGGTPYTLPPEARVGLGSVLSVGRYDQQGDVYALGMVMLQTLLGRQDKKEPLPDMGEGATYLMNYSRMTETQLFSYVDRVPKEYRPLLKGMLAFDRTRRPTAQMALDGLNTAS